MQRETGAEFPRFSDLEFETRRGALHALMAEASVDHLLLYGVERSGGGVAWITGWPVTREAVVVLSPGRPDVLLVQHYNHLPIARRIARATDVRWGGADSVESALEVVAAYGGGRLGVIGPLGHSGYEKLASATLGVEDMTAEYTRLRLVKSAEEIEWLREGARLSDLAVDALLDHARAGLSEHELLALVEGAYVSEGGTTHIHYVGLTSMTDPDRCVPSQYPRARRARAGDVLTAELSAAYWGYAGQVLRTFVIDAEPTPLYRELHEAAQGAFDAILRVLLPGVSVREAVDAARVIEDAGFTTYDDLIHGFGGGYLPPIAGSQSRALLPVPDMTFKAGMTIVVQPNVITSDERAGVQTGELVLIADHGAERLHSAPTGLLHIEGLS
jgi:Xaa-Pro aminopeptidase